MVNLPAGMFDRREKFLFCFTSIIFTLKWRRRLRRVILGNWPVLQLELRQQSQRSTVTWGWAETLAAIDCLDVEWDDNEVQLIKELLFVSESMQAAPLGIVKPLKSVSASLLLKWFMTLGNDVKLKVQCLLSQTYLKAAHALCVDWRKLMQWWEDQRQWG